MKTEMYWIPAATPGRLAVMPRPRGGDWLDEEVRAWRLADVDIVVSLLTPDEVTTLDLSDEESFCRQSGIELVMFPIPDRSAPPSRAPLRTLATRLARELAHGRNVAIHCRQGIGRAPLVAICVLIMTSLDLETATMDVSLARGVPVPETLEQKQWLADFARTLTAAAPT